MLNEQRLKGKILAAFSEESENDSAEDAADRIAEKLSAAIVEEIRELRIIYTAGLVAPNGAVTGSINHTVE